MKVTLLVIGKTDEKYLQEGILKYTDRLKHYVSYEMVVIPDLKNSGKLSVEQQKTEEGKLILQKAGNAALILLDEQGKEFTSKAFSEYLQKKMNQSISHLCFVIGGPYGFSKEVYEKAQEKISMSQLTFSHQMIRLFFTEQLYRAFTILKGEKYHHS